MRLFIKIGRNKHYHFHLLQLLKVPWSINRKALISLNDNQNSSWLKIVSFCSDLSLHICHWQFYSCQTMELTIFLVKILTLIHNDGLILRAVWHEKMSIPLYDNIKNVIDIYLTIVSCHTTQSKVLPVLVHSEPNNLWIFQPSLHTTTLVRSEGPAGFT